MTCQVVVICEEPQMLDIYRSDCYVEYRKQESKMALETVLVTVKMRRCHLWFIFSVRVADFLIDRIQLEDLTKRFSPSGSGIRPWDTDIIQCSCCFDLEINYPKSDWHRRVNHCSCVLHGGKISLRSNDPLYSAQGGPQLESQRPDSYRGKFNHMTKIWLYAESTVHILG